MDTTAWLVLTAVAVGAAVPMQSAINAQMASLLGHPLYGAVANTGVATLCLLLLILAMRTPAPELRDAASAPWYLWLGGLIGAGFVFGALYVAPRIGAAAFAAATIFGSAIASLAIDHFGLLGFAQRPVSLLRLAGAGCLLLGIVLLRSGRS
ncbi:MAG TPA: DMT family transporter [Rubrivivax sp.]|nr:DMT family transporter [Rubrivivax sp.]HPO18001.1 DMT family transporter [Rubrivivax sp.]